MDEAEQGKARVAVMVVGYCATCPPEASGGDKVNGRGFCFA